MLASRVHTAIMVRGPPSLRPPSPDELKAHAARQYIDLTDEEADAFATAAAETFELQALLESLPDPTTRTSLDGRDPGYIPGPDEDPYNAFATKCHVPGADTGPLAGYEIGVKDHIPVAGIPVNKGSRALGGFIPENDSTIITRLLEAGGSITGKLHPTELGLTLLGAASGPVRNPHNPEHFAGASSAGAAVAVVTGDVDLAIGSDGGGSIRYPAAWSGCVGYNPTNGLLPGSRTSTTSNTGPLAQTVADCALALEVMAGDGPADPAAPAMDTGFSGMETPDPGEIHIGVLEEGFGLSFTDDGVDETVSAALEAFEDAGATVEPVSVPWHRDAPLVQQCILLEGVAASYATEGAGHFSLGPYDIRALEHTAMARRSRGDDFPPQVKFAITVGEYLAEEYFGRFHAKAQNLRPMITEAYEAGLEDIDVLALPTSAKLAQRIDDFEDQSLDEYLSQTNAPQRTFNTKPFNLTRQPAISVPCGAVDGLPVGLMFGGSRFDDATVLGVASAFEAAVGWEIPFDPATPQAT